MANQLEMRWNSEKCIWEGNDNEVDIFDLDADDHVSGHKRRGKKKKVI